MQWDASCPAAGNEIAGRASGYPSMSGTVSCRDRDPASARRQQLGQRLAVTATLLAALHASGDTGSPIVGSSVTPWCARRLSGTWAVEWLPWHRWRPSGRIWPGGHPAPGRLCRRRPGRTMSVSARGLASAVSPGSHRGLVDVSFPTQLWTIPTLTAADQASPLLYTDPERRVFVAVVQRIGCYAGYGRSTHPWAWRRIDATGYRIAHDRRPVGVARSVEGGGRPRRAPRPAILRRYGTSDRCAAWMVAVTSIGMSQPSLPSFRASCVTLRT